MLKDEKSGQRLELNWYPAGSQYNTPYSAGDGLDHVALAVDDVIRTIKELSATGIEVVQIPSPLAQQLGLRPSVGKQRDRVAFIKDPDGNWTELYSSVGPIGTIIPESY